MSRFYLTRRTSLNWRSKKYQKLWATQEGLCAICGGKMLEHGDNHPSQRSIDHITPRSEGGSDRIDNYCLAHIKCNSMRKSKDFHKFKRKYGWALYWWFAMDWARNKKPLKLSDKGIHKTK